MAKFTIDERFRTFPWAAGPTPKDLYRTGFAIAYETLRIRAMVKSDSGSDSTIHAAWDALMGGARYNCDNTKEVEQVILALYPTIPDEDLIRLAAYTEIHWRTFKTKLQTGMYANRFIGLPAGIKSPTTLRRCYATPDDQPYDAAVEMLCCICNRWEESYIDHLNKVWGDFEFPAFYGAAENVYELLFESPLDFEPIVHWVWPEISLRTKALVSGYALFYWNLYLNQCRYKAEEQWQEDHAQWRKTWIERTTKQLEQAKIPPRPSSMQTNKQPDLRADDRLHEVSGPTISGLAAIYGSTLIGVGDEVQRNDIMKASRQHYTGIDTMKAGLNMTVIETITVGIADGETQDAVETPVSDVKTESDDV